ncbi:MAG: sulfatase [Leadbetterella sp.]
MRFPFKIVFLFTLKLSISFSQNDNRKNILFISVDDLNHWVGYTGRNPQSLTPNIDKLSASGVSFKNAHCVSAVCCPSRASVMSGLYPHTSGVYRNVDDWRLAIPKEITLPTFFKKNGYRVVAGGKIYHGGNYDREEEFDSYFHAQHPNFQKLIDVKGVAGAGMSWAELSCPDTLMPDFQHATWAISELQKKQEKPFFIALGFHKPHLPFQVPKKYFDPFPLESIQLPPYLATDLDDLPSKQKSKAANPSDFESLKSDKEWKEVIRAYLASIHFVDDQIGRVLDALESSEFRNNTIVVLWGDHGWHLGEKNQFRKFTLWEEATRAPFIWRVPGITPLGKVSDQIVDLMSIYPTLASLCNFTIPNHIEGKDITTFLKKPSKKQDSYVLTAQEPGNFSIRDSKFRYIRYQNGDQELYDERIDPFEWKNLANNASYKNIMIAMDKKIPKTWKPAVGNNGVNAH